MSNTSNLFGMDDISDLFDADAAVARYRDAFAQLERQVTNAGRHEWLAIVERLRTRWKNWQGQDSLHEMAFGKSTDYAVSASMHHSP